MKMRTGFVSNSSSSSFIIKNISGSPKSLVDFAMEVKYLATEYEECYDYGTENCEEEFVNSAHQRFSENPRNNEWAPYERKIKTFGDEDGDSIGRVFDYMLRYGGESESFSWEFYQHCR